MLFETKSVPKSTFRNEKYFSVRWTFRGFSEIPWGLGGRMGGTWGHVNLLSRPNGTISFLFRLGCGYTHGFRHGVYARLVCSMFASSCCCSLLVLLFDAPVASLLTCFIIVSLTCWFARARSSLSLMSFLSLLAVTSFLFCFSFPFATSRSYRSCFATWLKPVLLRGSILKLLLLLLLYFRYVSQACIRKTLRLHVQADLVVMVFSSTYMVGSADMAHPFNYADDLFTSSTTLQKG